jgi:hypothetical protein
MTGKRIGICILVIFSLFSCNGLISDSRERAGEGGGNGLASLLPVPARYVYVIAEPDETKATPFSVNDIRVYTVSADGTMREVPIDDCTLYTISNGMPLKLTHGFVFLGPPRLQTITVEYAGKSASYVVTLTDDANAINLPPPGGDTGISIGITIRWGN